MSNTRIEWPDVCADPVRELRLTEVARGKPENGADCFGLRRDQFVPVDVEEDSKSGQRGPLVAIEERMILGQSKSVGRRQLRYGRRSVGEQILGPGEGRFKKPFVTHSGETAVLRQKLEVDSPDLSRVQPDDTDHLANSRKASRYRRRTRPKPSIARANFGS